jgi:hypothetical protein
LIVPFPGLVAAPISVYIKFENETILPSLELFTAGSWAKDIEQTPNNTAKIAAINTLRALILIDEFFFLFLNIPKRN